MEFKSSEAPETRREECCLILFLIQLQSNIVRVRKNSNLCTYLHIEVFFYLQRSIFQFAFVAIEIME